MTLKLISLSLAAVLIVGMVFAILSLQSSSVQGAAPMGLRAEFISATTTEIGPQATSTIFVSKNRDSGQRRNCTSRIISTTDGSGIPILFTLGEPTNNDFSSSTQSGNQGLSLVRGHFQAGSTTIAYDSGIYGCGEWNAIAPASTTVTLTEFN